MNASIQLKFWGNANREIINDELEDPMVRDHIVSVIGVRTSSDLSHTKVYVSVLASDEKQIEIFKRIKKAENFIQRRLTEELDIRKVPEVHLLYDESMEQGSRVLDILKSLNGDNK